MDKTTRAAIEKATQRARRLLEDDFTQQLEGTYDVLLSGQVAPSGGPHLEPRQHLLRKKIVAAVEHKRAAGMKPAEAVADYLRDAAFTALNRFAALKMLEARALVQECISKGDQSSGYQEFCGLAPGVALLPNGAGYRLYLECILDELSTEVKVLFDRRNGPSALWPRRSTFEAILDGFNSSELAGVWREDETIGWIYQFFNSDDERIVMRRKSRAPRNAHELAVRNQFFTPRYIVEFLLDNSLGRTWYEMQQAKTRLIEDCRYFVRRRSEIFLSEGQIASGNFTGDSSDQEISHTEPLYIQFRPKKDPRDLKVLDPACGSGHFLLYAFNLLLSIYEEGWSDATSPVSEITGRRLRDDYTGIGDLRSAAPALILKHNLYGIDIDLRATQIASLALWMRAQRAYGDLGLSRADRPRIEKTNVVVAEAMPGEKNLRHEFLSSLDQELAQLAAHVFGKMELASELGSLLKIDDEVRAAIRDIYGETGELFRESDEERWLKAEVKLNEALEEYSRLADKTIAYTLRLFVDDTHQGLAFLNTCAQRYDVVVTNPPFGEASQSTKKVIDREYPRSKGDLLANFAERIAGWLHPSGIAGLISSRTPFFLGSFEDFRRTVLLRDAQPSVFVDLGEGVLDATVETCTWLFASSQSTDTSLFIRLVVEDDRQQALLDCLQAIAAGGSDERVFVRKPSVFAALSGAPWAYWVSPSAIRELSKWPAIEGHAARVRVGLQTSDDFRFLRLIWEVPTETLVAARLGQVTEDIDIPAACRYSLNSGRGRWVPFSKTDAAIPWYSPITMVVNWAAEGAEIKAFAISKGNSPSRNVRSESDYFRPGFSYMLRSSRLVPYLVPSGTIPTAGRAQVFPKEGEEYNILAVCASIVGSAVARFRGENFARPKYQASIVQDIPVCKFSLNSQYQLRRSIDSAVSTLHAVVSRFEPFQEFAFPAWLEPEPVYRGWNLHSLLGVEEEHLIAAEYGLKPEHLKELQRDIDEALSWRTRRGAVLQPSDAAEADESEAEDEGDSLEHEIVPTDYQARAVGMISYAIGVCFGRWDIRVALSERDPRRNIQSTPMEQMLVFPPGGLLTEDGLPAVRNKDVKPQLDGPIDYPVEIAWNGILVDDEGSGSDLANGLRGIISILSPIDNILAKLEEAVGGLSTDIREWLRTEFFSEHLSTYTSNRRKAPIYWQLSTATGSYSIWLYYHRLTKDTFYKILNMHVGPKLNHEERRLAALIRDVETETSGVRSEDVAKQATFVDELRALQTELELIAPLWNPNLDDGVIINFAPLWRLVPHHKPWQKELKATWDALCAGDYDWAHLAMHLWPERVVPKCATDRSLAIAHGLEDVFWVESEGGKWKPRPKPTRPVDELVRERTSAAVKTALKSLLEAPVAPAGNGRGRPRRGRRTAGTPT